jgi:asparagine synthase (glutamine-hydrolysing)
MCGIAGIAGENVKNEYIKIMTDSLKHRGPDDEGYLLVNVSEKKFEERGGEDSKIPLKHIKEPVNFKIDLALGHRRLSIIDLSPSAHQPLLYKRDGKCAWIVYNGEIYNYLELKEELVKRGYEFKTSTDTEVVLASYFEWGFDCVKKFNGMWAFVIYDPENGMLFGSRDRSGVKPLYYLSNKEFFIFASEIKAILSLPFVRRRVNEKILYDYLVYGILEHSEETFFEGIYKLPPSHNFIYSLKNKDLKINKYYELEFNPNIGHFSEEKLNEYSKKLKELIFEAIKIRLRSDVPVGTCLSGGLDSSTIAVVINEILKEYKIPQVGNRQKVFTACYMNEKIDESLFAEEVVKKTNAEWYKTFPKATELLSDLIDLIYYQEEPFGSTSIYAQYRVMKLAKNAGIKVILDGQGGDEIFGGYASLYASFFLNLFKDIKLHYFIKELINLKNSPVNLRNLIILIVRIISAKYLPASIKIKVLSKMYPELSYINPNFLKKFCKRDPIKNLNALSFNENCYIWFGRGNLQQLLKYEDRNSMAHSIEARVPFSDDIKLIEFVFSIPGIYKIRFGWSKYILREAMKDLLPEKILKRKDKIGFATPEKKWLAEISEDLKKLLDYENPYIKTKELIQKLDELIKRLPDHGLNILWRIINVILWMKIFNVEPKFSVKTSS